MQDATGTIAALSMIGLAIAAIATGWAYIEVKLEREAARTAKNRADLWSDIAAARGAKLAEYEAKRARGNANLKQYRKAA
jgi:uncharacterized membrane protein YciS (DUF1049 family)